MGQRDEGKVSAYGVLHLACGLNASRSRGVLSGPMPVPILAPRRAEATTRVDCVNPETVTACTDTDSVSDLGHLDLTSATTCKWE